MKSFEDRADNPLQQVAKPSRKRECFGEPAGAPHPRRPYPARHLRRVSGGASVGSGQKVAHALTPPGFLRRDLTALPKPDQVPNCEDKGNADYGVENPVEHL